MPNILDRSNQSSYLEESGLFVTYAKLIADIRLIFGLPSIDCRSTLLRHRHVSCIHKYRNVGVESNIMDQPNSPIDPKHSHRSVPQLLRHRSRCGCQPLRNVVGDAATVIQIIEASRHV